MTITFIVSPTLHTSPTLFYELVRQLADVTQTVTTRQNLDERTKVFDAGDTTFVNLADLNGLGQSFYLSQCGVCPFGFVACDRNNAIVVHLDHSAGLLLNGADRFFRPGR